MEPSSLCRFTNKEEFISGISKMFKLKKKTLEISVNVHHQGMNLKIKNVYMLLVGM